MRQSEFANKLFEAVRESRLLTEEESLGVGVSGGPDSVALLYALLELQKTHHFRWKIHVLHLDHRYRGEASAEDARFVRRLAESLALRHVIAAREDIQYHCESSSLEDEFRCARYAFFSKCAEELNLTALALGHTADDQSETILANILRGAGLHGLCGMPVQRPLDEKLSCRLVRPLLNFTRSEIIGYLTNLGAQWREDESNLSLNFTRNRLRRETLPRLEELNPNFKKLLLSLASQARSTNEVVERLADDEIQKHLKTMNSEHAIFHREMLTRPKEIVAGEALRKIITRLLGSAAGFGKIHFESMIRLAKNISPNTTLPLPHGLIVRRQYEEITISHAKAQAPEEAETWQVELNIPGETFLPDGRVISARFIDEQAELHQCVSKKKSAPEKLEFIEELFDADKIRLPLFARNVREGDRYRPLGLKSGSKKVARMMLDAKFTPLARAENFVVDSPDGIVWAGKLLPADKCKITPQTKRALFLRFSTR